MIACRYEIFWNFACSTQFISYSRCNQIRGIKLNARREIPHVSVSMGVHVSSGDSSEIKITDEFF